MLSLFTSYWLPISFLFKGYSQRSHLARIKGRVNKGMMPFSRSSVQLVSPWLTLSYRLMLFKKPKLFCKTQHQTKPKRQHNKLRHKLRHQLRLMKFLWRFVNFIFSVLYHVFRSGFQVFGLFRFHASVLFCPPGFNVCHFSCGLCGPFCNFYLFVVCPALSVSPLCGLCGLCFSLPCF